MKKLLPKYASGIVPIVLRNTLYNPLFYSKIGQSLRNRMYNTVSPHGYNEQQVLNFISGKKREVYGDPNAEALFGLYTNQDSITADVSQWNQPKNLKPRMIGEGDLGRFATKDLIRRSLYNPESYELIYPEATDSYGNNIFRPHDVGKSDWYHNEQLGWYLSGTDKDSIGKYNYAKDVYDINPFKGSSSEDGTIFKYGKYLGLDKAGDIVPFGKPYKIDIRKYVKTK